MRKLQAISVFSGLLLLCSCAPRSYISQTYDFNQMNRIGLLAFSSPGDTFRGAENLFAKQLLRRGYTVVERAQIEQVLGEQNLTAESYLSPEVTRKLGKILGVDVLLMGEITSYLPAQRKLVYNVSKTTTSEPVFRNQVVTTPEGETVVTSHFAGTQQRRERNVQPSERTIFAQVGVTAKMVDVNTAEVIWVGSDTNQGVSGLDAVSSSADVLIRSFDSEVRRARKRR